MEIPLHDEPQNQSTPHRAADSVVETLVTPPRTPPSGRNRNPITFIRKYWKSASKKKRMITVAVLLAVLSCVGIGAYLALRPGPPPPPAPVIVEPPEPEPEPEPIISKLTGMEVTAKQAARPVTAVTIENSPDARPQSGLADAGVVFESNVEGSITRFLALYQEDMPKQIGPIRSVRRNHIDWILSFDAAVAHVGGSPFALARVRNEGVKDLDQFQNPEAYRRVNTRFAPHNMYSTRKDLLNVHKKRGYNTSKFKGFVRQVPKPADKPNATQIDVQISSPLYNVRFEYDKKTNTYKRFMGGVPHVDEQTNKQITSDVVVVLVADYRRDGIYSVYQSTGSNTAFIYQDGTVIKGKWEKPNKKTNYRFGDKNGLPIGLNPGKTWITLAKNASDVTSKP